MLKSFQEIQCLLIRKALTHDIYCMAVGVVWNDKVWTFTLGFRDVDKRLPVTDSTNFCIASITKSFTALLTLKLQEEGLINIYDPVIKYLPEVGLRQDVEIWHLLSHTSGIPALCYAENLIENLAIGKTSPFSNPETVLTLLSLGENSRVANPGESYLYLNEGYVAVGKILEKVTSKSYSKLLEDYILKPLRMNRTYVDPQEFFRDPDHADLVLYSERGPVKVPFPSGIEADGGIISNVKDMLKYVTMLINRGNVDNVQIISKEMVQEFEKPRIKLPYNIGDEDYYGLGIAITKMGDITMFHHSGSILSHTSHMAYIPEKKLGIVVLMSGSSYPPLMVTLHIISKLLNIHIRQVKWDNILDKLTGTYATREKVYEVKIVRKGALLEIKSKIGRETILIPEVLEEDYCRFFTYTPDFRRMYAEFIIRDREVVLRFDRYVLYKVVA